MQDATFFVLRSRKGCVFTVTMVDADHKQHIVGTMFVPGEKAEHYEALFEILKATAEELHSSGWVSGERAFEWSVMVADGFQGIRKAIPKLVVNQQSTNDEVPENSFPDVSYITAEDGTRFEISRRMCIWHAIEAIKR